MVNNSGKNLRQIREQLKLKYRDVTESSKLIAARRKNSEFAIGLSRLADIENKGTVPSVYRMYSLAAIYGLDYSDLLSDYGVALKNLPGDAAALPLQVTRPAGFYLPMQTAVELPVALLQSQDLRPTNYFRGQMRAWGRVPLQLLESLNLPRHRYAFVGTEDWSMYPLIAPGALVQIDETKRRVLNSGWENDFSRPIYLLELRAGYRFGWCTERAGTLIVQPHPASPAVAEVFKHPGEVEVVGQVVAVAMRLGQVKQPRKRSA